MEVLALAVSIFASVLIAVWQLRASARELSQAIERAIKAIHEDIRHSQEKLEKRIEESRKAP